MSTYPDQTFAVEPKPGPPAPQRSWLASCLVGCLVVGLLSLLVCGGVAWYLAKNIKSIASNVARQAIVSTIEQSELDPAEKQAVIAEVDRVVDQYRSGKITLDEKRNANKSAALRLAPAVSRGVAGTQLGRLKKKSSGSPSVASRK